MQFQSMSTRWRNKVFKEASNSFSQPTDHTGFGFNSYVIIQNIQLTLSGNKTINKHNLEIISCSVIHRTVPVRRLLIASLSSRATDNNTRRQMVGPHGSRRHGLSGIVVRQETENTETARGGLQSSISHLALELKLDCQTSLENHHRCSFINAVVFVLFLTRRWLLNYF